MQKPYNQYPNNNQSGIYNNVPPNNSGFYQPPVNPYVNMNPEMIENMQKAAYYRTKRNKERNNIILTGIVIGIAIISVLFIQVIAVSAIEVLGYMQIFNTSSVFQSCFNVIAVHLLSITVPFGLMSLILKKNYDGPVIPDEKVGCFKSFMWISFGMGCCLIANIVTGYVIKLFELFGYKLTQPELLDVDSVFACVVTVVSTALIPALCEEFAMRCCTLGVLKKYGKAFAVIAVSVVFGLLHGNIIQFVFAFLVGLILGYITVRTNSVIPAVLIHAFNNGLSVLQDIITFASSDKMADRVLNIIYIAWAVLSLIGLIYLVIKKELLPEREAKKEREPYSLSIGAKFACLIPGLLIPFILLIVMSATTIQKI